jgi:hypothetical protein
MASKKHENLTNLEHEIKTNYKIAGFMSQLRILSWKNFKLSARNKTGTVVEILAPILLILLLLILRIAVNVQYKKEQNLPLNNINDNFIRNFNFTFQNYTNQSVIYYYPNNTFIENIVRRSIDRIKNQYGYFSPLGKN